MLAFRARRQFLGWSLGAMAGTAVSSQGVLGQQLEKSRRFSIGLQSFSLRNYPIDETIRYAKELGFEHIEFSGRQLLPTASAEQIAAIKKKMQATDLKMLGHGVNKFTNDQAANRKLFEFAKSVGLRNITADPSPDAFDGLDKLVAEFDIRIAIHNHGPSHHYNKVVDVLNAIKGHDPRIGACADLGHYIRSGEDPVEVIRSLNDRLYGIHLKDFDEPKEKAKGVILGRGQLDVAGVFQALRRVNFPTDGCLSIEYEENPKDPIEDLRQCLAVAREAAAKAMG